MLSRQVSLVEEPREVELAMTVTHLRRIDDACQSFEITFFLQLLWVAKENGENWKPFLEWRNALEMVSVSESLKPTAATVVKGEVVRPMEPNRQRHFCS